MGCFASLCHRTAHADILDQYHSLVVEKPSPVTLEALDLSGSSDTDVPLFAQVSDDLEPDDANAGDASDSEGNERPRKWIPK
jgi:hypothetical protein